MLSVCFLFGEFRLGPLASHQAEPFPIRGKWFDWWSYDQLKSSSGEKTRFLSIRGAAATTATNSFNEILNEVGSLREGRGWHSTEAAFELPTPSYPGFKSDCRDCNLSRLVLGAITKLFSIWPQPPLTTLITGQRYNAVPTNLVIITTLVLVDCHLFVPFVMKLMSSTIFTKKTFESLFRFQLKTHLQVLSLNWPLRIKLWIGEMIIREFFYSPTRFLARLLPEPSLGKEL